MKHEGSTFCSGCAGTSDLLFFAKGVDDLIDNDEPNSSFFRFKASDSEAQFRKYDDDGGWPAISMATCKPGGGPGVVVAIGPNGDYWEVVPSTMVESMGMISGFAGNLRRVVAVNGEFMACGMNRVVLLRQALGRWASVGPGAKQGDPAIVGFEDIDGWSAEEIYAVGWHGEIWWRDRGKWKQVDSPTNTTLSSLAIGTDGVAYAVGHDGTLVKGRRDQWRLVDTGMLANLKDVSASDGVVRVCSDFALYTLTPSGLMPDDDFADEDRPATCLHLLPAPGAVFSLGTKDLFIRDGGPWRRIV